MDHEELVAYLSVLVCEESFHENSIISLAVCACVCEGGVRLRSAYTIKTISVSPFDAT